MNSNSQREQSLFEAALDYADLAERRAFLDGACGTDKALRERIEQLLGLSKSADAFFTGCAPALEEAAASANPVEIPSAARSALEPEPRESSRFGPYKLLEKLGEGGCGVVYMAEQEQPVRRRVALKLIKVGMDTRSVVARFEAEGQALALMEHPNIAKVFDAGATESGRPYLVMELVRGIPITEYCDQHKLSTQDRLGLFIKVCWAIQHAHQKGIIHRDLKPSNILVTVNDGVAVPKVIDFGIAKAISFKLTDKTLFTQFQALVGTPAYLSPEQADMSSVDVDTRSDIYSLGVLLYELLVGQTPFDPKEALRDGLDALRKTIREKEAVKPSTRLKTMSAVEQTTMAQRRRTEGPKLIHQLRGDLDWIVMKCLEKDRARRYETANGLAMDVQRHLTSEPVLARPPSRRYRLQKLVRRNRLVFLSGAAVAAALLLGAIVSTVLWRSEARLRKEAELREKGSRLGLLVTDRRFEEADKLLADLPLDKPSPALAAVFRGLGDWHALKGRWSQAAERFASLAKVDQLDDPELLSSDSPRLAAALLRAGDLPGYEHSRQTAVLSSTPTNLAAQYWAVKVALVLPPEPSLLQSLILPAEIVEKRFPTPEEMRPSPPHGPQWSEALALLDYRRGRCSEALNWCYRCESYPIHSGSRLATTSVIKAMSNWRLGQYQTAVQDWTQAHELVQAKSEQGLDLGSTSPALFPGIMQPEELESAWYDWEIAGLLLRECNDLLAESDRSLDTLASPKPQDPAVFRALGEWRAIRGEWEQARKRFEYLRQLQQPPDAASSVDYYDSAITLLKLGDEGGFLRLRDEAFRRFRGTADEATAQNSLKIGSLRPLDGNSATNLEPFVQILDRALASAGPIKKGTTTPSSWNLMLLGLLEYRRGHYPAALDLAQRSLDTSAYIALPTATDRVIRAMSFYKMGNEAAARAELGRARSLVQSGLNIGFDKWYWREWLFVRLLLQEADGLSKSP
jgi:hypothetical protein